MKTVYSIIGLGKLGASMAAAIASRGYDVVGLDINQNNVDAINKSLAPVQETNLDKTIKDNKERLIATQNWELAILQSDVSFVIVPTPSDEDGAFSLEYAKDAFREIGKVLRYKNDYHLIVLTSTVLPGSTRYGLLPVLEEESGKKCGVDFGLCYSPEFIALGSIIHDFLNPDFNLVGEFDEKAGSLLQKCYSEIMANKPPCKRMSIENAELTKISLNAFVTTKITFANMLAKLCTSIPNGDIDIITDALGCDKRIGRKYLTGGLGYGGPCFPRDNVALAFFANAVNSNADISETTDETNDTLTNNIVDEIEGFVDRNSTIAILGLAYKPFSSVIEESQSIILAERLSHRSFNIIGYDPLANENAKLELKEKITIMNSRSECIAQADAVIIATPDPEFLHIEPSDFPDKEVVVYDCWRLLKDKLNNVPNIKYYALGLERGSEYIKDQLQSLWEE
jgi:UDPglucose 6-dehydrogenase